MAEATIGEATADKGITAHKSAFGLFAKIIQDFARFQGAVIKTSEQLSKMMAAMARLLADSIESALDEDEQASNVSMSGGSVQWTKCKSFLLHG